MECIYKNNYGATYLVKNSPNPLCEIQLIVDTVGIFMSRADVKHLLKIVSKMDDPCSCVECGNQRCSKVWCKSPLIDVCLKLEGPDRETFEDLIKGTLFALHVDETLELHNVIREG
ncbi:hypothetical protein [Ascidiimonas aurantiaca]|uniref:hypothetical protein n=1 Tax=Ascidiimonas aurantiaca TaxID=1685432 RepID=UPI0030EBDBAC